MALIALMSAYEDKRIVDKQLGCGYGSEDVSCDGRRFLVINALNDGEELPAQAWCSELGIML